MTFSELIGSVAYFKEGKIPTSTTEGHLRHLGEELVELTIVATSIPDNREEILEEVADLILTSLLVANEFATIKEIEDAVFQKLLTCMNSDWLEIRPGQFKRVK